jgi:hypothetical protein
MLPLFRQVMAALLGKPPPFVLGFISTTPARADFCNCLIRHEAQRKKGSPGCLTPVGDDASRMSAIPISEGFNLGYCRAKPGKVKRLRSL